MSEDNIYDGKRINFFELQDELSVTRINNIKERWDNATRKLEFKKPLDPNVKIVIELIKSRSEAGFNEYGTDTTREDYNVLDWLNELQSELLDGAIYVEVLKKKYLELKILVDSTPNNMELGKEIRKIFK